MISPRENMLAVYRRNDPEFVPLELPLSSKMVEVFKEKTGSDKQVEEYFGISSRWLGPKRIRERPDFSRYFSDVNLPEGTEITEWGEALIREEKVDDCIRIAPLRNAETIRDIENFPFPSVEDYDFKEFKEVVKKIKEEGYCVHSGGISFFEACWNIRGFENFLTDIMINKEFAHTLFDIATEIMRKNAIKYVEAGIDVLTSGSDVGTQNGLLISTSLWREFVKPMMGKIISTAKKANPEILIFYHSCGKIEELIPELIELGVDILNPIQPECNDIFAIKKKYGDRLSFFGGIGVQSVLPFGKPEKVKMVVRNTIGVMGKGGGYVCAPAHTVRQEVPWKNILAFVEAVKEYGRY